MGNSSKGRDEIQITNIDPNVKEDLQLIVKNKGGTLSGFLRPHLRRIRDENKKYLKPFKD